ncbi:MAG: alpha-D-ribose 1-methylphosphonate 5-triphosphate diphosphatase [Rubrimonas sp.]|uniref:alpha-D-ribose 1-methylphosphonate 5-triphosphate diphosphatase n=1 Tax=Rubrimonas sp. TaxID=2036015 RepID=UPI002FDD4926
MPSPSAELTLANARVVAPDRVFVGAVLVRDGMIADISEGARAPAGAVDCEGDHLLPGLVELHTDNLERHLHPRPGVDWPRRAAVAAHDAEFAAGGATTVLDALRLGSTTGEDLAALALEALEAIGQLRALDLLRADHFVHLRCELTAPELVAEFDALHGEDRLRLISIMDHTPGQRQFASLDQYVLYYRDKKGFTDAQLDAHIAEAKALQEAHGAPNLAAMVARMRGARFAIASHDDATEAHVAESAALGAGIAEFPTTLEAARASRAAGMRILMGAPNVLRGKSHSGNVSALELARDGLVDILSSDYAPASLLLAAFKLAEEVEGWTLPRAVACVTRNPAEAVGLDDRGAIEIGRRADLARVYHVERLCVTRGLWRAGRQVL